MIKRLLLVAALAAFAFVLDQSSKWLILNVVMLPPRIIEVLPVFNLTLGFNTGISFGLFSDALDGWVGVMTLFKLAVAAGLMIWAALTQILFERIGLSLMAGGAIGNAFDRWRQGAVTDFLDFHWGDWHFPTFNLADVAITFGVLCILAGALVEHRHPAGKAADLRPEAGS
ncbi:MAG: signal peptidase II [Bosea sp. (in: a-proteobacteria)]